MTQRLTKAQRKARATVTAHIKNMSLSDIELWQEQMQDGVLPNSLLALVDRIEVSKRADENAIKQLSMFDDHDASVITRPPFQQYFL